MPDARKQQAWRNIPTCIHLGSLTCERRQAGSAPRKRRANAKIVHISKGVPPVSGATRCGQRSSNARHSPSPSRQMHSGCPSSVVDVGRPGSRSAATASGYHCCCQSYCSPGGAYRRRSEQPSIAGETAAVTTLMPSCRRLRQQVVQGNKSCGFRHQARGCVAPKVMQMGVCVGVCMLLCTALLRPDGTGDLHGRANR